MERTILTDIHREALPADAGGLVSEEVLDALMERVHALAAAKRGKAKLVAKNEQWRRDYLEDKAANKESVARAPRKPAQTTASPTPEIGVGDSATTDTDTHTRRAPDPNDPPDRPPP